MIKITDDAMQQMLTFARTFVSNLKVVPKRNKDYLSVSREIV
jgi:hypothetical protein